MIRPLVEQANDLSRRIYASFPWGYRLAGLLVKLAFSLTETVGNSLYGLFIEQGVQGMPLVDGKPASDVLDRIKGHPERLPRGYGKAFGERLYAYVLNKARQPEDADEVMSRILLKIPLKKIKIQEGINLRAAEAYAYKMAGRELVDYFREIGKLKRKDRSNALPQMVPIDQMDGPLDLSDPNAFQALKDMLPQTELHRMLRDIEGIHERATSWVEAQLEGITNRELAAEWGVTPPVVNQWEQKYVSRIKQVVLRYLRDAA